MPLHLSTEMIVIAGRGVMSALMLGMYVSITRSRLVEGPWWKYFIGYLVVSLLRDVSRMLWLAGVLPENVLGLLEWAWLSGLRLLFVSGFVAFALKPIRRSPFFWAAIALAIISAFAWRGAAFLAETDNMTKLTSTLTGIIYAAVIWQGGMRIPRCRTRVPCMMTGLLFAARYWVWWGGEALGWLTRQQAIGGSLIWGGFSVVLMLMCFLTTNLLLVARERAEYERQAIVALDLAATFIERQHDGNIERRNRANGASLGRTEPAACTRVGASQA